MTVLIVLSGSPNLSAQIKKITKYYDKEQEKIKETFEFNTDIGLPDGDYRKFHQNENLAIVGQFQRGIPFGNWMYYYENGALKSSGFFEDGKRNGSWEQYYENGNLKSKGLRQYDSKDGLWTYYFENGKIKRQGYYQNNLPTGQWDHFYETGPIKAITNYDLNENNHTSYYLDGSLKSIGTIKEESSTGFWTNYYQTGEKLSEGIYVEGFRENEWRFFYKNGNVSSEGNFEKGKKTGNWNYYHLDGKKAGDGIYQNNLKQGDWVLYGSNGETSSIANFINGSGEIKSYHSNGQLASVGFMKEGKTDSTWTYFDESGNLIGSAQFTDGEGQYVGFHPNGNKSISGLMKDQKRVGEWKIFDEQGEYKGSYYPVYKNNLLTTGNHENEEIIEEDSAVSIDAQISNYRYENKTNRYFDEVINEFDAFIFSTNPLMMLINHLPLSIEYYQQERLGYEVQYHYLKSPFLVASADIDINEVYHTGHLLNLRQKFYSRAQLAGMYYFGHQIQWSMRQNKVNTQDEGGFREIFTSTANESLFIYGWFIGWKWMQDAGEQGFTIDSYLGINLGIRNWKNKEIEDSTAEDIFSAQNQDPFVTPITFGVNFGFAKGIKKRKRRRNG